MANTNIIDAIESLANLLTLKPAAPSEITNAEKRLGLEFAEEYKRYIEKFGAVIADDTGLTGIAKSPDRDVITVTEQERALNPLVSHDYYVVENVGIDGIIIWQDTSGSIYQTAPNQPAHKIYCSLTEYLASKQKMKKFNLSAVLYPQENGGYTVLSPELRGCVTEGKTLDEARENFKEAAVLTL